MPLFRNVRIALTFGLNYHLSSVRVFIFTLIIGNNILHSVQFKEKLADTSFCLLTSPNRH